MSKFEKRLKSELDSTVPDLKDNIRKNIDIKPQKTVYKKAIMPVLLTLVLIVAIVTPILVVTPENNISSYVLSISVNPSIELIYDNNGIVTKAKPLNRDGMLLLQSKSLKNINGNDVDSATNLVIDEMKTLGIFNNVSEIKISVKNNKGKFANEQFTKRKDNIQTKLTNLGLTKDISQMSDKELDKLEDNIEDNIDNFYNEFMEDVKTYLDEKSSLTETLLQNVFNELVNDGFSLTDKNDLLKIKQLFKDNETEYTNQNIINLIVKYNKKFDEFDEEIEEYDDIYDIYSDILEELEETNTALTEINNGNMPDDVDDIIEDLLMID